MKPMVSDVIANTFENSMVLKPLVKHSLSLDDKPVPTGTRREKDPTALEVDALSKGGKSKSSTGQKSVTCPGEQQKWSHASRLFLSTKARAKRTESLAMCRRVRRRLALSTVVISQLERRTARTT